MQSFKKITQRALTLAVAVMMVVASSPLAVFAQDTTPATTPTTTSAPATPAKQKLTYTYDEASGRWNSSKWQYDSASGTYKQPAPPPVPAPAAQVSPPAQSTPAVAPTGTSSTPTPATSPSGPSSANTSTNTNVRANETGNTNNTIGNQLNSAATTGNADVVRNTAAGNATTGNASAQTTTINSVHSTVGGDAAGVAHFTVDIEGDVTGDIMLRPMIDAAKSSSQTSIKSDATYNTNNGIVNDITLSSTSGDATVASNTKAGNATSGTAHSVANVMNLINSIIAANQSFIGTINIHGNLNGDILISPEFIPQLLGSNASSQTTLDAELALQSNSNQSIINNIQLQAASGNATVDKNTQAGSATTGTAQTNLTVLNLTGREVDASNSLLVFVNVLGKWVGMIVDAPGATSAALGSGVTKNNTTLQGSVTDNNNGQITNNINLAAQSGDATVQGNTEAGNATSGNATASANIANINTSVFKVNDWFGLVFINVFGVWVGSFGIDTSSGTVVPVNNKVTKRSNGAPNMQLDFVPKQNTAATESTQWWPRHTSNVARAVGSVGAVPKPVVANAVVAAASVADGRDLGSVLKSDIPAAVQSLDQHQPKYSDMTAFLVMIVGMLAASAVVVSRRIW